MSVGTDCIFCNGTQGSYMRKICGLEAGTVFLSNDQRHRGRCYVVLNKHRTELFHLEGDELSAYMRDVANTAKAVQQAFSPDKINYAAYGDNHDHLHFHVVPKQRQDRSWGAAFELTGGTALSEDEYEAIIALIKRHLQPE